MKSLLLLAGVVLLLVAGVGLLLAVVVFGFQPGGARSTPPLSVGAIAATATPTAGALIAPTVATSPAASASTVAASPVASDPTTSALPVASAPPGTSASCPPPPARDLHALTQSVRLGSTQAIPRTLSSPPPDYQVGDRQTFWVTNMETYVHFTTTATLRYRTSSAYFYLEDGVDVPLADLQRSADEFESHIYPSIRRYLGSGWGTGVNNDPRLTILNARVPGVGGYYSVTDEYTAAVNPHSNQRKMLYVNVGALRPGMDSYNAVLSHELVHAVHWNVHRNEQSWVSEGLAELGAKLAGHRPSLDRVFLTRPDTQLTGWPAEIKDSPAHYGAAFLFWDYFAQHYGGYEALSEMIAQPYYGTAGLQSYLARRQPGRTFDDVFRDWIVANYLDDPQGGPYSYADNVRLSTVQRIADYGQTKGSVYPYAADYLELALTGDVVVQFNGQPEGRILPTTVHGGRFQWWSNRADGIDSTLTREFDLTGLSRATLRFWLWYDIEKDWDYAYVEVSADGGATWKVLAGDHSATDNPLGNGLGPGYTGQSGEGREAAWVEESIDLSPYAGQKVLVRFQYVTDEGVNKFGLAIDDISLPELGYEDGAEQDGGWEARGFVRTDNRLDHRFAVRLIKPNPAASVEDLPLDGQQQGQITLTGLDRNSNRAVLAIAATTPCTTLPADYQLTVERLP